MNDPIWVVDDSMPMGPFIKKPSSFLALNFALFWQKN